MFKINFLKSRSVSHIINVEKPSCVVESLVFGLMSARSDQPKVMHQTWQINLRCL